MLKIKSKLKINKIKPDWSKTGDLAYMISNDNINMILSQFDDVESERKKFIYIPIIYWRKNIRKKIFENLNKHFVTCRTRTICPDIGIVVYIKYHWLSLYVDMQKREIRYFESNADDKIRYKMIPLIKRIRESMFDTSSPVALIYNNHSIQTDDYSCGLYAIDFITMNIEDRSYRRWLTSFIKYKTEYGQKHYEKKIMEMRKKYFKI